MSIKRISSSLVCFIAVFLLSCHLWADSTSIVGKLKTDSLTKSEGTTVTILYTVENSTTFFWTPVDFKAPYHFEVFDIADPLKNGGQMGQGDLVYTQEQYVGPNSTAAFAVGNFVLQNKDVNLAPGFYRILLYSPEFRNNATGVRARFSASTAIQIVGSARPKPEKVAK